MCLVVGGMLGALAGIAEANPDPIEWSILDTPGSVSDKNEIVSPSEVNRIAVAPDSATIWAVDTPGKAIRKSSYGGWWWNDTPNANLHAAMASAGVPEANRTIWDVATAADGSDLVAVVTGSFTQNAPVEVWISEDGGAQWDCARFETAFGAPGGLIGAIDISPTYETSIRDIAVGIRNSAAATNAQLEIWVVRSTGFQGWKLQTVVPAVLGATGQADVLALSFSPTYFNDAALAVVFCDRPGDTGATYFDIALRDTDELVNDIVSWVFNSVEVKDPSSAVGASPDCNTIVTADLKLPANFSGLSANLRRAYVAIDATGDGDATNEEGIYRVDDTTIYELMDTTTVANKSIATIAYYGTYASGKLLAGEVNGFPCEATVPTWFTDSPTTCPIPCWYPALKPTTGAANQGTCAIGSKDGYGNAQVAWSPDGTVAYCGTSSADFANGGTSTAPGSGCWPEALTNSVALDESALSLTRNNGETWNQTGLIDTNINKLTDVAPSADSCTVYVASVNTNAGCSGFDSVWRSSTNSALVTPLPVASIGTVWERVLCRVTASDCTGTQSNQAILRLAPDKTDGQIVFWAAQGSTGPGPWSRGVVVWSPDYGDYWANINPRLAVQDLVAESSTVIYILQADGMVQKMPYTGTAWSSAVASVDTSLGSGYSIVAVASGHVLVGAGASSGFPVAYSGDSAASFTVIPETLNPGNVHVAFDANFTTNGAIYAATENATAPGGIYRNMVPSYTQWANLQPLGLGYHGLAIGTRGTLYTANPLFVERTLYPATGIAGDDGQWDVLMYGLSGFPIRLTLSPNSLKLSGGVTSDDNTKLWAIDNDSYMSPTASIGRLWTYEDCLANAGPTLTTEDATLVNCDPVSGRAAQISLSWERLCLERFYKLQIADDAAFTQGVWQHLWYEPPIVSSPNFVVPAGGMSGTSVDAPGWVETLPDTVFNILGVSPDMDVIGLEPTMPVPPLSPECGHKYYWRIRTIGSADDDLIRSPWSETRSFTVKCGPGGISLLSPDNGAIGCPVSPASFSWSPFMGSTSYKFQLASDAAMTDIIDEDTVATTAYQYAGTLDYSTNYFWCVMCVEPAPSDWSATFSFQTEAAPAPPSPGGSGSVSISIPSLIPAIPKVKDLAISPREAQANEPITISANVVNSGGTTGSYTVILMINGQVRDEKIVSVSAGATRLVKFTVHEAAGGTCYVSVAIVSQQGSFTITGDSAQNSSTNEGLIESDSVQTSEVDNVLTDADVHSANGDRGVMVAVGGSLVLVLLLGLLFIVVRRRLQAD